MCASNQVAVMGAEPQCETLHVSSDACKCAACQIFQQSPPVSSLVSGTPVTSVTSRCTVESMPFPASLAPDSTGQKPGINRIDTPACFPTVSRATAKSNAHTGVPAQSLVPMIRQPTIDEENDMHEWPTNTTIRVGVGQVEPSAIVEQGVLPCSAAKQHDADSTPTISVEHGSSKDGAVCKLGTSGSPSSCSSESAPPRNSSSGSAGSLQCSSSASVPSLPSVRLALVLPTHLPESQVWEPRTHEVRRRTSSLSSAMAAWDAASAK